MLARPLLREREDRERARLIQLESADVLEGGGEQLPRERDRCGIDGNRLALRAAISAHDAPLLDGERDIEPGAEL